jgi:hypothetical protein
MPAPTAAAQPQARRLMKPAVGISRPHGLLLLAIGLGLGGWNVYLLINEGHYYPKAMLIAPIGILMGMVGLIVGKPVDPQTGQLPLWARILYGSSAILGIALGIMAIVFVGC